MTAIKQYTTTVSLCPFKHDFVLGRKASAF